MAKRSVPIEVDEEGVPEEAERTSRTDLRRARQVREKALARLAEDLVALSPVKLEQLELSQELVDSVVATRAIPSAAARNRQLRVVRGVLRDSDWGTLRSRLDELVKTGVVVEDSGSERAGQAAQWVVRLLGEGSAAIEALIEERPNADRTHLRQLVRNVEKASTARRAKAEQKLAHALRSLLR